MFAGFVKLALGYQHSMVLSRASQPLLKHGKQNVRPTTGVAGSGRPLLRNLCLRRPGCSAFALPLHVALFATLEANDVLGLVCVRITRRQ